MNKDIMQNISVNKYVLIGAICVLLFLVLITYFIVNSTQNNTVSPPNTEGPSPVPSSILKRNIEDVQSPVIADIDSEQPIFEGYSQEYLQDMERLNEEHKEELQTGANIGKLINKTPYQGKYFKIDYSFRTISFVVTFNRDTAEQGDEEFNEFLKKNGIENRSALENLQIIYE